MICDGLRAGGWFDQNFSGLKVRHATFKAALTLATEMSGFSGITIVETGCMRADDLQGAGNSTFVLASYAHRYGGHLTTIDISPENIEFAKKFLMENIPNFDSEKVTFIVGDSVDALENHGGVIDLLYLDSFDYPYGGILEQYGGKEDINKAIQIAEGMTEEEVVLKHGSIIEECQEHCRREVKSALNKLSLGVVLIDDNKLAGGGKPRLAKKLMHASGFMNVLDDYQTLWISTDA